MNNQNVGRESIGGAIVKGIAISGLGNVILRFLDAGIAILLLRWLSVYQYGIYNLSLAAYGFFTIFFIPGLENVIVSEISRNQKSDERSAKALFSFYTYLLMIVGVLLWTVFFWSHQMFSYWVDGSSEYLRIISFLFLLTPIESIFRIRFNILLNFDWGVAFKIVRSTLRIMFILISSVYFGFGINEALWSIIVALFATLIIFGLAYRAKNFFALPSLKDVKNFFKMVFLEHGKWALVEDFFNSINQNIRPFIIKFFVGAEAVALISVAQNLISYVKSVLPIRDILFPIFPRTEDIYKLRFQVSKMVKYSTIGYTILGAVSALAVPILVYLLFPKYITALPLFYILLLGMPPFGIRSLAYPIFYTFKAQRDLFLITFCRSVISAFLLITLVYFFGITGAVLEMLIVGILTAMIYNINLKKYLPDWRIGLKSMFIFDEYDKSVLSSIISRFLSKLFSYK